MTVRTLISQVAGQENLNFLLTNRIPRRGLTLFVGWLSRIRNPFVRDASIAIWKLFSDLDLSEARKTHFDSLHDCFTRELKEGARPVDPNPDVLTSPCDGIIGACGQVSDGMDAVDAIESAPTSGGDRPTETQSIERVETL